MNEGRIVFSQLMDHAPMHEFRRCVARYGADYWLRKFSCWDQFLCMAFAQLAFRVQALREDVLPWLQANVPVSVEHQARMDGDQRVPRLTMMFDREGYSPDLFEDERAND